ncbi:hypothetical protein [Segeticoccus rhizosphaerae]|uniref:hypothetical protein n=1 Tax=Segeticoccus rhizosphaerae TaxID=1104777 RepID=UPI0013969EC9|nr:hypothetical protein [Segeticoccus rhizosphaerae]
MTYTIDRTQPRDRQAKCDHCPTQLPNHWKDMAHHDAEHHRANANNNQETPA